MGPWIFGALPVLVGVSLVTAPWWSTTLPRTDYALTIVLGVISARFARASSGLAA